MSAIPMVATARQTYNGKALKSGDEFDAISSLEADDLEAVNMARRRKARLLEPQIKTRVIESEAQIEEPAPASTPKASKLTDKQAYDRRDMRAKR